MLCILIYVCYCANAYCVKDVTLKVVEIVLHRSCYRIGPVNLQ